MTKIRTALVSAVAVASLVAGGVAMAGHSSPRHVHHLAGPVACCGDNSAHA